MKQPIPVTCWIPVLAGRDREGRCCCQMGFRVKGWEEFLLGSVRIEGFLVCTCKCEWRGSKNQGRIYISVYIHFTVVIVLMRRFCSLVTCPVGKIAKNPRSCAQRISLMVEFFFCFRPFIVLLLEYGFSLLKL